MIMKMRTLLLALLHVFFFTAVHAQKEHKPRKPEVAWKTYSDTKERVSMQYPATWEKKDVKNTVFFFWAPFLQSGQKFRENVNLSVGDAEDLYLIEYLMDARTKMPQQLEGFKELGSKYVKIGGRDCARMTYQFRHGEMVFQSVLYIFLNNGKAYTLNFSALPNSFDKYFPTFDKMANSFRIK